MTFEDIFKIDTSTMYHLLKRFPAQVEEAITIGQASKLKLTVRGVEDVVLSGLGGSAIGGDLLRSYLGAEMKIPFLVNRNYTLPAHVGPKSLVIISSYSGNTEETLAAYEEALRRKARVLCITSGGMVAQLARRKKHALLTLPGGLPPRVALGYSFFPLLFALMRLGFVKSRKKEIQETVTLLLKLGAEYGDPDLGTNKALELATLLAGRIGVVYSACERLEAVNTRWRGQIAENGKSLMFGHVIPEMNHNELVGWKTLTAQMREMQVIFLRDKDDHDRVQLRIDITRQIVSRYTDHVVEVWSEGTSLLARLFSLVYLGDWVSFYLAILNGVDPTPVEVIDHLKEELGKTL